MSSGSSAASSPASIADAIAAEGGRVTFARFMQLALTHPTLGYYCRADRLFRHGGDFSTAPALSPFFNATAARLVTELVDAALEAMPSETGAPAVVELGGGEGQLARSILGVWQSKRPDLRDRIAYRIVEIGGGLRRRQASALRAAMAAGWDVGWGPDLSGASADTRPLVVLGNEFIDALPAHLISPAGGDTQEAYVEAGPSGLTGSWGELSEAAAAEVNLLFGTLDPEYLRALAEDGVLEVRPALGGLMREVAGAMAAGTLVTIDYGEWFPGVRPAPPVERWGLEGRPLRARTIRGYFKHQMALDPLARPGRQDLTADVDFAALDLHGRLEGFETVAFTTLAAFLRGGGAEAELERLHSAGTHDPLEADRQATALQNLLDERDLGGAFKVMIQVRE